MLPFLFIVYCNLLILGAFLFFMLYYKWLNGDFVNMYVGRKWMDSSWLIKWWRSVWNMFNKQLKPETTHGMSFFSLVCVCWWNCDLDHLPICVFFVGTAQLLEKKNSLRHNYLNNDAIMNWNLEYAINWLIVKKLTLNRKK